MNILIDQLPAAVMIDDMVYDIDADFRNCLNIILAFEDPELSALEKQQIMVELLFDEIPDNYLKALEIASKFLNFGQSKESMAEDSIDDQDVPQPRVYSFTKDSQYIYTAFKQTYGIDLQNINYLHWWQFCFMFFDLSEDCFFVKLVDLRSRKIKGKLTKEEKIYCASIKDIFDLPVEYTQQEKEAKDKFYSLLKSAN